MDKVKKNSIRSINCPLCDLFTSKRLTLFEKHLNNIHNITSQLLWNRLNNGSRNCACGCGNETKWLGWWKGYSTVILGHNGLIYAMYKVEDAKKISFKRSSSLKGKINWAKGLTSETDERIKKRGEATSIGRKKAFNDDKIKIWNIGLTKETDERIFKLAQKTSIKFLNGELIPWAKGLTKKTDERLANMASKVSLTLRCDNIRNRLDTAKRLTQDDIRSRVEASGYLKVVGGLENYINDAHKIIDVICNGCGQLSTGSLRSLQYGKCFKCSPGGSVAQELLAKWLVESTGQIIHKNNRSCLNNGLEIDIFNPMKKVGIEYNGLYWHSHINKSPQYHNNKTKKSLETGIKLIHVFEDEWRDKQEIVKSMILSKLGLSCHKIGARKLSIKELSIDERKLFFNNNHIDGDTSATLALGLVLEKKEIVCALSLRKPLHKKQGSIEVARCCSKLGFNIQGGVGKLINAACHWAKLNGYENIITYVDTRLGGDGICYIKAGLKKSGVTPPRFWWTDFTNRFNRFKYRADKSKGLTEIEVAESAGVVKIWGCENIIYSMSLSDIK